MTTISATEATTPAEMYSQGYRFSFHDQQWIYPTDTVSQRELEEIKR